jgi:hypothetical protein
MAIIAPKNTNQIPPSRTKIPPINASANAAVGFSSKVFHLKPVW